MKNKTDFNYPHEDYVALIKDFYSEINGTASLTPVREWESDNWSASSTCSRGTVLEKAGFGIMHIVGGTVYQKPGSLKLFETLAYPTNPKIPGLIFVVNLNETEDLGRMIVYLIDLIIQDGKTHDEEKNIISAVVKRICDKHERNFEKHYALEPGRLLAGNGAECGIMDFFKEQDIPFLDDLIRESLPAYREILEIKKNEQPQEEDYQAMYRSRARIVEWITVEDIGVKIAKDNGIPLEIIESYGFPPVVKY